MIKGYWADLSTGAFVGGASGVVPVILAVSGRWHSDQNRTASTWERWWLSGRREEVSTLMILRANRTSDLVQG